MMHLLLLMSMNLILSFLSFISCLEGTERQSTHPSLSTKFKSFTIQSVLRSINDTTPVSIYIDESYSNEQSRSKIKLQVGTASKEFYYDSSGQVIEYDPQRALCSASSKEAIYKEIFLNHWEVVFQFLRDRTLFNHGEEYIIGPAASLLFLICKRSDYFVENYWPIGGRMLRNVPVAEYLLRIKEKSSKEIQLNINFSARNFSLKSVCESIPIQIGIKFPDLGATITIDYFKYSDEISYHENEAVDDIELNKFTIPISRNCSSLLNNSTDNLFSKYDITTTSLSFSVISSWLYGQNRKHFVAYDGTSKSLRIDSKSILSNREPSSTSSVIDMSAGREYNIFNNHNLCFITQSMQSAAGDIDRLSLEKFLIGSKEKMAYMGIAKVRGVSASVYETYATHLPLWFLKPIPVRLNETSYISRYFGTALQSKQATVPNQFNVVVYTIADRLLLLQVFDLVYKLHNPQRVFKADFYNFQFDLNESPNGLTAQELFSIKDECSSPDDRNAKVEMLLEGEDENSSKFSSLSWFYDWTTRNTILLAALSESLNIPVSLVYDLETKLLSSDIMKKLTLSVSFKIVDNSQQLYVLNYLGNIGLKGPPWNDKMKIIAAHSPSDCLRFIDDSFTEQPNKSIYVYYFQWMLQCLTNKDFLDGNKTGPYVDLTKTDADIFTTNNGSSGELYRIDAIREKRKLANSFLEETKVKNLRGRVLTLRVPDPSESSKNNTDVRSEQIRMHISVANLRNINYVRGIGREGLDQQAVRFSKLGLAKSNKLRKITSIDSIQRCEAACLTDLDCRTYSFCVRSGELECLLTKLNIQRSNLLNKLEEMEAESGENLVVQTDDGDLELVRDFRCELRAKLHLDLFKPAFSIIHTLRSYEIIPVSSREECAEICFARNLETIKVSASMATEQVEPNKLDEIREKFGTNMRLFCKQFKYMSSILSENQEEILTQLKTDREFLEGKELCILAGNQSNSLLSSHLLDQTNFEFELYKFDYTSLYEKKYGVRLLQSAKQDKEDSQRNINKKDTNYQLAFQSSQLECAESCFMQTTHIWPACRSFDHLVSRDSQKFNSVCVHNTATLNSLNFSKNLISYQAEYSPDGQSWHYEPRFGLINEVVEKWYHLKGIKLAKFRKISLMLSVSLGILTGLLLSIWITRTRRLTNFLSSEERFFTRFQLMRFD